MAATTQPSLFATWFRTNFGRELVIYVPPILQGVGEIEELIALRNKVPSGATVAFDFSQCTKLSLNGLVLLGGLAAFIRQSGGSITVRTGTIKSKLRKLLMAHGGLLGHLGVDIFGPTSGPILFDHYKEQNKTRVMGYLEKSWLGVGRVRLSPELQAAIMGNVWEVYANAFEHSESVIGIVNCCSYDRGQLHLSVMDLGIGIPTNVRRYRPDQQIGSKRAMQWAFALGTSTKAEAVGYSRGIGLHTLKEFIRVNKGFMEVFSNDGYARITKDRELYRTTSDFPGTLVHIVFKADDKFYFFSHEAPKYRGRLDETYRNTVEP